MAERVEHRHRYVVQEYFAGRWKDYKSYRFKWVARHEARFWEKEGFGSHRVVDLKEKKN